MKNDILLLIYEYSNQIQWKSFIIIDFILFFYSNIYPIKEKFCAYIYIIGEIYTVIYVIHI